ncbi:uncharacterized protein V1518DRAFT_5273 [Limtongia smithiae]|uniref:uncharacterized protein n=1 Tax=Limtongia smithiae TaxID=1125753 RepID=UPI0034D002EA
MQSNISISGDVTPILVPVRPQQQQSITDARYEALMKRVEELAAARVNDEETITRLQRQHREMAEELEKVKESRRDAYSEFRRRREAEATPEMFAPVFAPVASDAGFMSGEHGLFTQSAAPSSTHGASARTTPETERVSPPSRRVVVESVAPSPVLQHPQPVPAAVDESLRLATALEDARRENAALRAQVSALLHASTPANQTPPKSPTSSAGLIEELEALLAEAEREVARLRGGATILGPSNMPGLYRRLEMDRVDALGVAELGNMVKNILLFLGTAYSALPQRIMAIAERDAADDRYAHFANDIHRVLYGGLQMSAEAALPAELACLGEMVGRVEKLARAAARRTAQK